MAPLLALVATSCVPVAGTAMITPAIALFYSPGGVPPGEGKLGDEAKARLEARPQRALASATQGALAAAAHAPDDVRLQRRAGAMVRELAQHGGVGELAPQATHAIEHLVDIAPCPGLADAAATWLALGDPARAGDAYVQAAKRCDSVEAAIAAVAPLRQVNRCEDALAALRAAWPRVHGKGGIAVLDGVARCSDAITLRRNLSFAPPDVVEDYFALLEQRRLDELEAERRAESERREREAESRAFAASSRCSSECSAAVSSCTSSCAGDAACLQRCSALGHACSAGC